MGILSVDLQEGFSDDTVVLHLNGEEVYRQEHVATMRILGLADSFTTNIEEGPATLDIAVETQGIARTVPLDVTGDIYLGVSLVAGDLETFVSSEALGYA